MNPVFKCPQCKRTDTEFWEDYSEDKISEVNVDCNLCGCSYTVKFKLVEVVIERSGEYE